MTEDELLATVEDRGVRLVRFLWCGNDGTVRAKASSRHGLAGRLGSGIGPVDPGWRRYARGER